ncbi:MAG: Gfo/Idh/MocA family oxidoreductase [Candidatus Latescibacterota bacterium]
MLTVAVIGCGRVVQVGHLLGLKEVADQIRVVAVADPVAENRDKVGEALAVPPQARFSDYHDLLDAVPCDFVNLALPHFLHEEVIIACAKAGRHILTEKPLTTSMESAARIASAVREANVDFGIQHNYRYFPHFIAMRRAIAEGQIGKPFFVRNEGVGGGGHWPGIQGYDPDWRIRAARAGGGTLLDNGYHNMYMCEFFMGTPVVQVLARVGTFQPQREVDDLAVVLLTHEDGGISSVQVSWAIQAGGRTVIEVHGTEGSLQIADDQSVRLYRNSTGEWETIFTPTESLSFRFTFADSFRDFASALEEGRPPAAGLQDALHNLAIIMAGYESEHMGKGERVMDEG